VHFKGSGFYSTDYGKGSRKAAAKEGEAGKDGGAAKESKPATDSGSSDKKAAAAD
jgi:predicted nucleic acid-binding Zn ribbon protein